jgi:hypothetical protein
MAGCPPHRRPNAWVAEDLPVQRANALDVLKFWKRQPIPSVKRSYPAMDLIPNDVSIPGGIEDDPDQMRRR